MSWPKVKLGDLITTDRSGASLRRDEFTDSGIIVVPKKAISDKIDIQKETFVFTSEEIYLSNPNTHVSADFLITTLRNLNPNGATLGLVCRHDVENEIMLAQGMYAFKLSGKIDPSYLCYVSRTQAFRNSIKTRTVGSTQVHIRAREFKDIEIELPPLEEQRKIAAILDKADEIKKDSEKVIPLRKQLLLAKFNEMFGDLRINTMSWPEKSISELCDRVNVGYVGPLTPLYVENGIRCLRGLNIKRGRISNNDIKQISSESHNNLLKKSRLNAGDVVAIRTGNAGVSAVISEEYDDINCADLIIMTPGSEIEPSYLCEFLNQKFGDADSIQGAVGAIQKHFNIGSAKKVMVPLPPMKLQHRYNRFLHAISQIDSQVELAEKSSFSIIQEMLT